MNGGQPSRLTLQCIGASDRLVGELATLGHRPPQGQQADLLLLSARCLEDTDFSRLRHALCGRASRSTVVVLLGATDRERAAQLLEDGVDHFFMGDDPDPHDISVTLRKLEAATVFGAGAYLEADAKVERHVITRSTERGTLQTRAQRFAKAGPGMRERTIESLPMVVDELVTNAFYNAPVTENGHRTFRALTRDVEVSLPERQGIEVRFLRDSNRLAIATADPFGSLEVAQARSHMVRGLARQAAILNPASGGAGIGLFQVFEAMGHLVVNIAPGYRTEMVALCDFSTRRGTARCRSFHLFTQPEPAGR